MEKHCICIPDDDGARCLRENCGCDCHAVEAAAPPEGVVTNGNIVAVNDTVTVASTVDAVLAKQGKVRDLRNKLYEDWLHSDSQEFRHFEDHLCAKIAALQEELATAHGFLKQIRAVVRDEHWLDTFAERVKAIIANAEEDGALSGQDRQR